MLTSTPYYAQVNGYTEASNKVIVGILNKKMEGNPRGQYMLLSKTIQVYKTSKKMSTGKTLFTLRYGHNAVLPMEIVVQLHRVAYQHRMTTNNYIETMIMELKQLDEVRLNILDRLITQKRISKGYNKHIWVKVYEESQLVWKTILPLGMKDKEYGN